MPPASARRSAAASRTNPAPDAPDLVRRSTYRHGDLHRALLDAAVAAARIGGPGCVVLRDATRIAGVAPSAAYRHFASHHDLLQAVRAEALASVADAMQDELDATRPARALAERARRGLRAVGTGYLRFALDEPGLFRTAFGVPFRVDDAADPAKAGRGGLNPFQLLGRALDAFVDAGLLSARARPGAEFAAWSAVHGMALLAIDGPLRVVPREQLDRLGQRLLDMVEAGLQTPRAR